MTLIGAVSDWLSQECTILRGAEEVSASRESRKVYSPIASGVRCQFQVRQGAFTRALYGDRPTVVGTLFVEVTDVVPGDRVALEGEEYVVDSVNAPRDTEPDHVEALLSRLVL